VREVEEVRATPGGIGSTEEADSSLGVLILAD
jgi:hypothetical protein